jgi:hypothetical protein
MEPEKAVDAEVADSWFAADCWFSVGTRNFLFASSSLHRSRIYRAEFFEPNFLSGRRAPCREFHSPQAAGMKTGPVNPARRS